jgi:hypothetical protein
MAAEFEETQRFTQRWLWVLFMVSVSVLVAVFGHGLIQQLVFDRPWGDRPISDAALVLVTASIFAFVGSMIYIFHTLRLVTRVDRAGVFVRFVPFPGSTISFSDIQSCEARTYRPLYEYGGWGIKWGRSGKAYNISGDRGAQLAMKTGKRVLIGSQRADELAAAINRHLKRAA